MSNSFRRQPTRRLIGGYFVRRSGVDAAKLIADGFWEQSASQGGIVEAAFSLVGTGPATARGATVAAATAGAGGAGAVSGRGVAIIGTARNASGSGSAAGLGATIAVAAISATGAGGITGAAGGVPGTDAAFSIQGAGAVTGRGAAAVSAGASVQGAGAVTSRGTATASTALSASGICVGAFAGAAVAGTAATAGGTASAVGVAYTGYVVAADSPGESRTMCVGGACGGQAPTARRRSRKRGEPKVIQTIKVGHWPAEAELRVKPVDSPSIFCISCE